MIATDMFLSLSIKKNYFNTSHKIREIDSSWSVLSVTKNDILRKITQKKEDTIEEMIVENLSHMEEKSQLGT